MKVRDLLGQPNYIEDNMATKEYTREEQLKPVKWIKVKRTGVVTCVSKSYYETYEGDGWFIETTAPKKTASTKG